MHQIRFRLGLRSRPRWGSLQLSPDPLAGFKEAYFSANLFTVDSRRVVPARKRRDPEDALYKCTDLITSVLACANFGPNWPLLFKVHEI